MRKIAATVRFEGSTRRVNRVNHAAEVVAFLRLANRARAVQFRISGAHCGVTVMADQAELVVAIAIRAVRLPPGPLFPSAV